MLDIYPGQCYDRIVKEALHVWEDGDDLENRIEELRDKTGLRQEELAKALGVSRQTISSLENGRYNPSILLAHRIAQYFNLTIEEVFIFDKGE